MRYTDMIGSQADHVESHSIKPKYAQFIVHCSSLKHRINGWKHFCRTILKYAHDIELYILILSVGCHIVALEKR